MEAYVNPNFVTEGNETEKYISMIKREKAEAARIKRMQDYRKSNKKTVKAVVVGAVAAALCTAAYKTIDGLKNHGFTEVPVRNETPLEATAVIDGTPVEATIVEPETTTNN